jgi:hypothetical protein
MFGDADWIPDRYDQQYQALTGWLRKPKNLVVIEMGAGLAVPTVRYFGEYQGVPLIRINVRDPEGERENVLSLQMGALEALSLIDAVS